MLFFINKKIIKDLRKRLTPFLAFIFISLIITPNAMACGKKSLALLGGLAYVSNPAGAPPVVNMQSFMPSNFRDFDSLASTLQQQCGQFRSLNMTDLTDFIEHSSCNQGSTLSNLMSQFPEDLNIALRIAQGLPPRDGQQPEQGQPQQGPTEMSVPISAAGTGEAASLPAGGWSFPNFLSGLQSSSSNSNPTETQGPQPRPQTSTSSSTPTLTEEQSKALRNIDRAIQSTHYDSEFTGHAVASAVHRELATIAATADYLALSAETGVPPRPLRLYQLSEELAASAEGILSFSAAFEKSVYTRKNLRSDRQEFLDDLNSPTECHTRIGFDFDRFSSGYG
jgi:hypothetical protein